MQQIASGQGDAYLVHLNKAINGFGGLVYVRPMAEMNADKALYNSANGPGFSPRWYRLAFARIYLILHGGPRVKIDVALKRLGLPYLTAHEDLPPNPKGKLRVIWNPVAGHGGWLPFYPGDRWVDLIGNDMYSIGGEFSRSANEELYAFARAHRKRYSFPEWGTADDQPDLVRYLCGFIKSRAAIELAAYFDSKAGSKWDLGPKPSTQAGLPLLPHAARSDALGRDLLEPECALDGALGMRTGDGCCRLPVAEEDHRRDRHHAVAHGEVLFLVDVELDDLQLARALFRDPLEHGRHGVARPAPLGPEVDEDGRLRVHDLRFEGLRCH